MTDILIFPYNGNGLEALACLTKKHHLIGFVDDDVAKQVKSELGFEVFSREAFNKYKSAKVLAVPGSPDTYLKRDSVIDSLSLSVERHINIIHPTAVISPHAVLGKNVLIMANVVVSPNAKIEDNVCILPNTVIHHDVTVSQYTLIGSNVVIAGHTFIGKKCYIGSGSTIINNIEIGDETLVGLGTNVVHHVKSKSRVVGNPSRYI
jgi:sugar O-acyltransferase (sialic acid O-acetyltransferase NeuD family)